MTHPRRQDAHAPTRPVLAQIGDVDHADPKFDRFDWERQVRDGGHLRGLSGAERGVLHDLSTYVNDHGLAWPGRELVAETLGMSQSSVSRAMNGLANRGLLVRCPTPSKPNRVALRVPGDGQPSLFDDPASSAKIEAAKSPPRRTDATGQAHQCARGGAPMRLGRRTSAPHNTHEHSMNTSENTPAAEAAAEGGPEILPDGGGGEGSKARLVEIAKHLDSIGWRSDTNAQRRAQMLAVDPERTLACFADYEATVAKYRREGKPVASPGGLFTTIWRGRSPPGGDRVLTHEQGVRKQLLAMKNSIGKQP